jgi:hypothetical protein
MRKEQAMKREKAMTEEKEKRTKRKPKRVNNWRSRLGLEGH